MSACYNVACPFRDKQENQCHLIKCDWVGGTARESQPLTPGKRAKLVRESLFIIEED